MDIDRQVKAYLAFAAVISATYGMWVVFERYNADTLELKKVEMSLAKKGQTTEEKLLVSRRDSAAKMLEIHIRARAHYQELRKDGELRDAEENRLDYLEQTVPELQREVEKLDDRINALGAE